MEQQLALLVKYGQGAPYGGLGRLLQKVASQVDELEPREGGEGAAEPNDGRVLVLSDGLGGRLGADG